MQCTYLRNGPKGIFLVLTAFASLLAFAEIAKGDKAGFPVEGMRQVDGEWQTVTVESTEYWVVDVGRLWYSAPADCELKLKNVDCGYAGNGHRIGASEWPLHLHVARSNWPTAAYAPDSVDAISQLEAEKMWYVSIYLGGTWNGKEMRYANGTGGSVLSLGYDNADGRIANTDASFHSNCHGYALKEAGLSRFELQMGDGGDGIQMVLDEYFTVEPDPEDGTYHMVMTTGNHSNWVLFDTGPAGCKKVSILTFKFRSSQTFSFSYNSPGRDNDRDFFDLAPSYWEKD